MIQLDLLDDFYAKTQFISFGVNKFGGRIFLRLASLANGTTIFCIELLPARNSANACNSSRNKPLLSEGTTTVDG